MRNLNSADLIFRTYMSIPLPFLAGTSPVSQSRRQLSSTLRTDTVTVLALVCLISAWLASVLLVETAATGWNWEGRPFLIDQKGVIYYALHTIGILAALGAGTIAGIRSKFSRLRGDAAMAAAILFAVAIGWGLVTYSQEQWLSTKIVSATGPFVWLSLVFIFAGMDSEAWPLIGRAIEVIAFATTILAVRSVFSEAAYYHYVGLSRSLQYAIILAWCGGWMLLNARMKTGWSRWIRMTPFVVFILTSVYAQARSWTIISALLAIVFFLGVPARGRERGVGARLLAAAIWIPALCVLLFIAASSLMPDAVNEFGARIYNDTRSQQYVEFFTDVQPNELVLGRGPEGTWHWPGMGDYQFIDNGYLWMAFIGGLPILVTYCILILLPAARVLWSPAPLEIAAAAWLLAIWALALGGLGTFISPSLGLPSYLMCLFAGRCHEWLRTNRSTRSTGQTAERLWRDYINLGRPNITRAL